MSTKSNYWETVYKNIPPDQISWNRAQADYFKHAIDEGKIEGKTALDIGCGTGLKSIYLAQHGFNTIGLDISPSAVEYCEAHAKELSKDKKPEFHVADILDRPPFLEGKTFDFILDWAVLHCLDRVDFPRYLRQILKLTYAGSYYLLRFFSTKETGKDYFIDKKCGIENKVCILEREEAKALFEPHFNILETKTSKPHRHDDLFFIEFLMQRK